MRNRTILIVEDDRNQLTRYVCLGKQLDLEVFATAELEDAKSILESKVIDILLTDIHLTATLRQDI